MTTAVKHFLHMKCRKKRNIQILEFSPDTSISCRNITINANDGGSLKNSDLMTMS